MREAIHYYACKYDGDYNKISQAIKNKEVFFRIEAQSDFVTIVDEQYPQVLRQLKAPPFILFYHGDFDLLKRRAISIIGSRQACDYAIVWTKAITKEMCSKYVIVSGMALGIDSVAHRACLSTHCSTIAILGCGINYIYPRSNKNLYYCLKREGLIISEFPHQVVPKPYFFPFRNRLIACLSESIIVTQAAKRSGTMITVNEALELNRSVYVLPYRIDECEGAGCNELIQQGANLIECDDIENLKHII